MQNPVTGSGGMLVGVVEEAGPDSPLGLAPGDRVATLVSLTLTPLLITDGLAGWDGASRAGAVRRHAILFGRSIAAVLPDDLPGPLALAVLDVCGAPALTDRVVRRVRAADGAARRRWPSSAGRARPARLSRPRPGGPARSARSSASCRTEAEADVLQRQAGLADAGSDRRRPRPGRLWPRPSIGAGGPADVTVVCVDVPGCEGGAILATGDGGTVIFFSMATSFTAAALGAEGLAADVTMLIGNGYVPGPRDLALDLLRAEPGVRATVRSRTGKE